ncbi:MAG: branched-chain amino acid ABC transporter permease [Thermodesulfobacteriota bacterium]
MPRKDYIGMGILLVFVLVTPFALTNDYYIGVLVFAALNCLTCIGLCLLMGYAGQISLGHGGFVAIGAYSAGILTAGYGWSPGLAICTGVVIVLAVAFLVGIPTLRLKGHYLAMATLGFGSIIHIVSVAATDLTGGPAGILNIPRISLFGYPLDSDLQYYYFVWGVVLIGLYLAFNLLHSRIGRGLRALHGSEDAAAAAGINTAVYKIQIFAISAVYAAVSGSLYAFYVNYIDPGPFDVMHSVVLVTMVAVGGLHSIWGAVTGALLLSLLPEILSFGAQHLQGIGIEYKPDYDILIYGAILLLIMLFLPEGLFGGVAKGLKSVRNFVMRIVNGKSVARE